MIDNTEKKERAVLVAASVNDEDTEALLNELSELVKTAGAETVATLIQNKEAFDNATYIGRGKVEELKDLIAIYEADCIVCDDELSPIQQKNLEDILDVKVLDRTTVILDIFAKHATTGEGKLQVELAQLKYRSTRLIGSNNQLSRLGGGIGTRGPGEKKLETDRRVIRNRIGQLNRELENVKMHRSVMRKKRLEGDTPVCAIVGYTNAGKSTLLNALTGAGVLEEDKLFATLDPTSRRLLLDSRQEIILTDTVGFIRKLPHHLINAFRSTLEEAKYADIIIHVVDISDPDCDDKMAAVYKTLSDLGIMNKPVITVFNKCDKVEELPVIKDLKAEMMLYISAKQGGDFTELKDAVQNIINSQRKYIEITVPYNEAGTVNKIRKYGTLLSEEYRDDGIFIKAYIENSFDI